MKTLCFIVNPIAGMGGAVGLKGTDGEAVLKRALVLGAKPVASGRAEEFLSGLLGARDKIRLICGSGEMGEYEALRRCFTLTTVGEKREGTTAEDTKNVARSARGMGADLLVFCGGDGTARDVLDAVDQGLPVLGVPTGVKMHSAVFAVSARAAARITSGFLWENLPLRETEVMDVDEEAFRMGQLSARLYGYVLTPYETGLIQGAKTASQATEEERDNQTAIASRVVEEMKPDTVYIIGPGTTTRAIADLLGEEKTLLGVDLLFNWKIIARDVNEEQILEKTRGKAAKIVVTPIGGQGFILGRGNQQISPKVVRQVGPKNIIVVATRLKLRGLRVLRVDSGDPELDKELRGYTRVCADYREEHVVMVE